MINNLLNVFNLSVVKRFPRHATREAIKLFGQSKITIAEIGICQGEHTTQLFKRLNISKAYLIDPYEEHEEYLQSEPIKIQEVLNKDLKVAKINLNPYSKRIVWIKDYSDNVVDKIPEVDFIYIDGNHSYNQVSRDLENYWNKIKVGGIFAGHDSCNKDVINALIKFCYEKRLTLNISREDWWIVKTSKSQKANPKVFKLQNPKKEVENGKKNSVFKN